MELDMPKESPKQPIGRWGRMDNVPMEEQQKMQEMRHWYALKVYYNRVRPVEALCKRRAVEYFLPGEAIGSLLFVRCGAKDLRLLVGECWWMVWVYRDCGDFRPRVIPDREMEVFRFVVEAGRGGLELLGEDKPEYHEGARVRVTGGPFEGAEGHIKRIKRDRRLVVAIAGVVAVATTYIHPSLLEVVRPQGEGRKAAGGKDGDK